MVAHTVSVDDDVMKMHILSRGRGEDGGQKISQSEQNMDKQHEGREDKRGRLIPKNDGDLCTM